MNRRRSFLFAALACSSFSGGALVVACGGDDVGTVTPVDNDAGTVKPSKTDGAPGTNEDTGVPVDNDAGSDAGESCDGKFAPPVIKGAGPCGTSPFGEPAAAFMIVDADGGADYVGTSLPSGIYDAVKAERGVANGSWRETFVVDGARFTRIRQIDTGGAGGVGPITYRSGTFAYVGQSIKLTYDCAQIGDAGADAGTDELPSDAITADCNARYRYGATGIRVTLRRR